MSLSYRLLILVLTLLSSSIFSQPHAKKNWTYLFYVAGDEEEIDPFSRIPLRKLEQVGSDESRWMIAQADFHFDETGSKVVEQPSLRYEIGKFPGAMNPKDFSTLKLHSKVVWQSEKEIDSGAKETFQNFLKWTMENYPAEHYGIFILGHSYGWRGIAEDDQPGHPIESPPKGPKKDSTMMSLRDVREAIESSLPSNQKFDFIVLDACNDAVLEIVYEFRNLAHYLVAAATEMPLMSFDYARTFSRANATTSEFLKGLVRDAFDSFNRGGSAVSYEGDFPSLSMMALDLEKTEGLWPKLRELFRQLSGSNFSKIFLGDALNRWMDPFSDVDLHELLRAIYTKSDSMKAKAIAGELIETLGNPSESVDRQFVQFERQDRKKILLALEGDEFPSTEKAQENAEQAFNYMNPSFRASTQEWQTDDAGGSRTFHVEVPGHEGPLKIRPFVQGSRWAELSVEIAGEKVFSRRLESPSVIHVTEDYPSISPYLITGHTFGAGRSEGLAVNITPTFDDERPEDYRLVDGRWLFGREYYASLTFSKDLGWDKVLFNSFLESSPLASLSTLFGNFDIR